MIVFIAFLYKPNVLDKFFGIVIFDHLLVIFVCYYSNKKTKLYIV